MKRTPIQWQSALFRCRFGEARPVSLSVETGSSAPSTLPQPSDVSERVQRTLGRITPAITDANQDVLLQHLQERSGLPVSNNLHVSIAETNPARTHTVERMSDAERGMLERFERTRPLVGRVTVTTQGDTLEARWGDHLPQIWKGTLTPLEQLATLTVAGRIIPFDVPVEREKLPQVIAHTIRAVQKIGERQSLRTAYEKGATLRMIGGLRLQMSFEREGRPVTYIATERNVLRVTDELPVTQAEQEQIPRLREQLKKLSAEHGITSLYQIDWDGLLSSVPPEKREERRRFLVQVLRDLGALKDRIDLLMRRQNTRVLLDDDSGERTYEAHDDRMPRSFDRFTLTADGMVRTEEVYREDRCTKFAQRQGDVFVSWEERYDRKGTFIGAYNEKTNAGFNIQRRTDGSVEEAWKNGDRVMYDTKGIVQYCIRIDRESRRKTILLPEPGANTFYNPLELSLGELQQRITTPDLYAIWEELIAGQLTQADKRRLAMRTHGEKICGVRAMLDAMRQRYGVDFRIDTVRPGTDFTLCPMHMLKERLPLLDRGLRMYPPMLLQRAGLREFFIVRGVHKQLSGDLARSGEQSDGTIWLSIETDHESLQKILHHELFHQVDTGLGTISEYHWWSANPADRERPKLSSQYARIYGMTNSAEDKATIAEELFSSTSAKLLRERAKDSPVLQQKIRIIESYYYGISRGKMDGRFWRDIERGEVVDAAYWERRDREGYEKNPEGEKRLLQYETGERLAKDIRELPQTLSAEEWRVKCADLYIRAFARSPVSEAVYERFMDLVSRMPPEQGLMYLSKAIQLAPDSVPVIVYLQACSVALECRNYDETVRLASLLERHYPADARSAQRFLEEVRKARR